MFQSTRPRGARPIDVSLGDISSEVSIHAPARGATSTSTNLRERAWSFNPRARAGRDNGRPRKERNVSSFNPRARAGRDVKSSQEALNQSGFNPRARAGRDIDQATGILQGLPFQSTRPRGARPSLDRSGSPLQKCFNPRARAGRDRAGNGNSQRCSQVSIHAPARGATFTQRHASVVSTRFQSTRPRGARLIDSVSVYELLNVSIHAPARGATSFNVCNLHPSASFNPRARAGRDLRR